MDLYGFTCMTTFSEEKPSVMYFGPTAHLGPISDAELLKVPDAYFELRRTPVFW